MLKRLAAAAMIAALLAAVSGCYRAEDAAPGMGAPRYEEESRTAAASAYAAEAGTTTVTAAPSTARKSASVYAATKAGGGTPDAFLLQQCINYNYAYPIVQAVAEGILADADETRLRGELEAYDRLNSAFPGVSDTDEAFSSEAGGLLTKEQAKEAAIGYIVRLFEPKADLTDVTPALLELRDYRQDPPRDWLGWETYYEVHFQIDDPGGAAYTLSYSAHVDGRTGKLVSGNYAKSGGTYAEITPTAKQIQSMQTRAKTFVTDKQLVPGASVAYVCSSTWGGASSELQTEVYLSDGTVVDIHEGYEEDTRLYFNLFPTHGFQ